MIKILQDRVIFDGHAEDKATCETTTLLANALAKSDDFKQVEYRSGYAEFEKVGKTSELRFLPTLTIVIYSNDGNTVLYQDGDLGVAGTDTFTVNVSVNGVSIGDNVIYTYSGNKTFLGISETMNSISADHPVGSSFIYSMSTSFYIVESDPTPTISFKHFYKTDTLIGTGTYKFRRYSQEEPVVTPRLAAPASVSVSGTIVTFESVANATSYEFFVDGVSIGEYTP